MPHKMSAEPSMTSAHRVGSIISTARQILRKDQGANELDRLGALSWLLFLKFVDDLEQGGEPEADNDGRAAEPVIAPPYRWRDWAAGDPCMTGDELLGFLRSERTALPSGGEGPGLFAYLRTLHVMGDQKGPGDRRQAISNVFKGLKVPVPDGRLLRDVIDQINGIDFTSPAEIHMLCQLYETMLRDAAADSGEFYTPRPLVRFMVEVSDPRLGETVADPACGTGGFLAEAMSHLQRQCRSDADRDVLQTSLLGGESRPLSYLLAQVNLLLHGLEHPYIDAGSSLRLPLSEIEETERVDLILTHPPFGGAEDKRILGNFPEDMQTAETTLLFLQLVMSRLKRPGQGTGKAGRAAMVVSNGTLFADGAAARIKEELLKSYDLHTIVRLPEGVFAPYTDIPTNLIFFDASGPTNDVWFYQIPLPKGRRKYTKTKPMESADFDACLAWWDRREENANAWKMRAADLLEYDEAGQLTAANLDIKNPNSLEAVSHRPPEELIADMVEKERWVMEIMEEIKVLVGTRG